MDKLWLIIKREYLSRVRKKTFILATILTPLAIGAIGVGAGLITTYSASEKKAVLVADESGIMEASQPETGSFEFTFSTADIQELRSTYAEQGYNMLVHIPSLENLQSREHQAYFYSVEKPSLNTLSSLENIIGRAIKDYKIAQSQIDLDVYESFITSVKLERGNSIEGDSLGDTREAGRLNIVIGTALGGIMGFMMYMVIFIFGSMVMRSVMEEKMNRIVEIMISSVRPFQLMLGKIIGVGAVGLTQLGIWLILIPVVLIVVQLVMGIQPMTPDQMGLSADEIPEEEMANFQLGQFLVEFRAMNWWLIIPTFVLFFLGGYFIYASLFAAIGSAISDDMGESQSLMLPIMIPVIFAFIMMPAVLENPNGGLAVFGSIFPLFSPIIMPARLAFDPPLWQVAISLLTMAATALFMVWISGRIYRVGILMYGKKASFKELAKWIRYSA
jgi:ABC-2 type transport system permease protein